MSISVRMKVTIPSELFNLNIVKEEIARAQRQVTGPKLKKMFQGTVTGWDNPPYFSQEQTSNFAMIAIKVFASGRNADQYRLVNDGAKPHPIYPTNRRGFLIFQPGYVSATRPGSLRSRPKVRYGQHIGVRAVNHPGFGGRFFDVEIADVYADEFVHDMEDAIHFAVQRTQSTNSAYT